jgi:hypothetical protein
MIGKPQTFRTLAALSLYLLIGALPGTVGAQDLPKYAQVYHESFKGTRANSKDLVFIGPNADAWMKFEPEGLRITLPAGDPGNRKATGVMTGFGVRGDFEITLSCEVLQEPALLTSLTLAVSLDKPNSRQNETAIHRRTVPGGFDHYQTQLLMPNDRDTKKGVFGGSSFTAKGKLVRFRLVRVGADVSCSVAEGADGEFKLLSTFPYGTEDLRDVTIRASAGGEKASFDVRVTDLLIRAAGFPQTAAVRKQGGETYREPFKGKPQKPADFVLIGKDASKYVKFEPEGLRVTLPAGAMAWQPTGVATAFRVTGDFDVSVRYEVLAEPEPADSGAPAVGTRISLTANVGGINVNDASIRRKVAPFAAAHILGYTSADKLTDYFFEHTAKTGRFRLIRTGDKIAYYLSEGADKDFKFLTKHPFSSADLLEIQVSAQTSGPNAVLDVRFTDFQINALALPKKSAPSKTKKGGGPSTLPKGETAGDPEIPTKEYAQTYVQPFKGSTKPAGWEYTAPAAEESVQFEPTGLRLTMPAGHKGERRGAGIQTAFGVKGDFEITLNFDFLQEPTPSDIGKFATRLLMGIALDTPNFDTPTAEVATLNRSLLSKGERTFTTWMRNRDNPQGALGGRPTAGSTGRLRLVRSGEELYCAGSLGADQPFALIKKYRFGLENLKRVAITGMTGHEKAMLDVRITDFSIRADAILGLPASATTPAGAADAPAQSQAPAAQESKTALLLIGIMIPLLGLGALAAWFFRARRGAVASPTSNVSERPPISFSCSHCAKPVKASAATAGKKVKCPRCRTVLLVPAASDRRH